MKAISTLRRFAFGAIAALALIFSSANTVRAQGMDAHMSELGIDAKVGDYLKGAAVAVITYEWLDFIVGSVVRDIKAGGLKRNYAEVVPGAGYRTSLAARMENSSELRAQMASWQVAEQYASAAH